MVSNLDSTIESLRDALPMKLFTESRIEGKTLKALIDEINKISEERFHEKDLIGRVYEYFLQAFSILKTVESTLSQIRRRRARGTSGLWPSSP